MGIILLFFWECLVVYKLTELGAVGVISGCMHICFLRFQRSISLLSTLHLHFLINGGIFLVYFRW